MHPIDENDANPHSRFKWQQLNPTTVRIYEGKTTLVFFAFFATLQIRVAIFQ